MNQRAVDTLVQDFMGPMFSWHHLSLSRDSSSVIDLTHVYGGHITIGF